MSTFEMHFLQVFSWANLFCNPQHTSRLLLPKQCKSNWKIHTMPGQRLESEREHYRKLTLWRVFRSVVSTSFALAEKYSFEFHYEFDICCKSRKIHILLLFITFYRLYELIGRKWCICKIHCIQGWIHSKRFLCKAPIGQRTYRLFLKRDYIHNTNSFQLRFT